MRPRAPSDPAAPLKLLAAGKADLAISYEPELLLARDRGLKLVVGRRDRPAAADVDHGAARQRRSRRPRTCADKPVGTAGIPYQAAYLDTILERAGVDPASVRRIDVGFNLVPAMLSRRVDATLGAFWNYEGVELAQRGRRPTVIRLDRVGVPTYNELIFVAREEDLREGGNRVRRFLRGVTAGYEATRQQPVVAVNELVRANPDLDRRLQLASVRATLPVFFPAGRDRPFGHQDAGQWATYGAWMLRNQLLRRPPATARAFTNEFLPGQGL